MKNLLLGLSVLSYGSGVADLLLCAWLVFRSKKAELASVAGSFSVFTLAILGPNLEFFQILFGGTSARLGWLVGGLATWISWILVLGVLAYAVFRGWRVPSEAQGGVSTRVFRMLAVVNLAFIVLFALGFFWNPRPALLSLFFLENLAYLAANVGSLFLVSRKVIGSEVGKASGPPPPKIPLRDLDSFGLSDREKEIIEWLNSGLAGKEIAYQLKIKSVTVKNHIYNIYQKTGVKGRVELLNLFRLRP